MEHLENRDCIEVCRLRAHQEILWETHFDLVLALGGP